MIPLLFFMILTGYGMTEVGFTHFNTAEASRRGSVGKHLPLNEIKVKYFR